MSQISMRYNNIKEVNDIAALCSYLVTSYGVVVTNSYPVLIV